MNRCVEMHAFVPSEAVIVSFAVLQNWVPYSEGEIISSPVKSPERQLGAFIIQIMHYNEVVMKVMMLTLFWC